MHTVGTLVIVGILVIEDTLGTILIVGTLGIIVIVGIMVILGTVGIVIIVNPWPSWALCLSCSLMKAWTLVNMVIMYINSDAHYWHCDHCGYSGHMETMVTV